MEKQNTVKNNVNKTDAAVQKPVTSSTPNHAKKANKIEKHNGTKNAGNTIMEKIKTDKMFLRSDAKVLKTHKGMKLRSHRKMEFKSLH